MDVTHKRLEKVMNIILEGSAFVIAFCLICCFSEVQTRMDGPASGVDR